MCQIAIIAFVGIILFLIGVIIGIRNILRDPFDKYEDDEYNDYY